MCIIYRVISKPAKRPTPKTARNKHDPKYKENKRAFFTTMQHKMQHEKKRRNHGVFNMRVTGLEPIRGESVNPLISKDSLIINGFRVITELNISKLFC